MSAIVMEVQGPDGYHQVGPPVFPESAPGSFSDGAVGREVYVFGWLDGSPGLWRSSGTDVEIGLARAVGRAGLAQVSDLAEPYYAEVLSPHGLRIALRISLLP